MKRHILRQMTTEWRSNAGLLVELVVTGLVLWGLCWFFASITVLRASKSGCDIEGVFSASIVYKGDSVTVEQHRRDLDALVNHFKSKPGVLHAGYGANSDPYNLMYIGNSIHHINGDDTLVFGVNMRSMSPELMEVYQIHGLDGASPAEMARRLERGDIFIGYDRVRDDVRHRLDSLVGSEMSSYTYRATFSTLINPVKRTDYEPVDIMAISPLENDSDPYTFAVRVSPEAAGSFVESLTADDYRLGSILLSGMKSMESRRQRTQSDMTAKIRTSIAGSFFLIVVIFLGFSGAFWFRTQQRRKEIAIRRVNGATEGDVLRRLLGEGLMLLVAACVLMVPCIYFLKDVEMISGYMDRAHSLEWLALGIALAVMALTITAGIIYPAWRAVRQRPADVLHAE